MHKPRYSLSIALISFSLWACSADKPDGDGHGHARSKSSAKAGGHAASQPTKPASQPVATTGGSAASQPAVKADPFSGLVTLADGLKASDIKAGDVLFVMARQAMGPGQAGRLVAVQRFSAMKFPLRYEMSAKNLMMPGIPFAGPFIVRARLDRDGDPMTKGSDDLYAEFAKNVANGDEAVHLVLANKAVVPGASKQPVRKHPAGQHGPAGHQHPASQPAPSKAPASQPAH
jgi:hypothetical protein